jgi:hypothetical protein
MFQPLRITIESTADGYLRWEIFYGPERTLHFAGTAPVLERVFEELSRALRSLADHLTSNPDALINVLPDDTPDAEPIAQIYTPSGASLPAQQDVPTPGHMH